MSSIFVFGSNLAGRHGKGAALHARMNYGAIYGQAEGLQGSAYGIPTKDEHLKTLPVTAIQLYVSRFITFARSRPDLHFTVTRVGCGLAGYTDSDIAPLFIGVPDNCTLDPAWELYLNLNHGRKIT